MGSRLPNIVKSLGRIIQCLGYALLHAELLGKRAVKRDIYDISTLTRDEEYGDNKCTGREK